MAIVKFGEVASRLNIHVDQANTDLEYYIGGEHIESSEFMIQSADKRSNNRVSISIWI